MHVRVCYPLCDVCMTCVRARRCSGADEFLNCLNAITKLFDNAEFLMQTAYNIRATRSLMVRLYALHRPPEQVCLCSHT
jgi:hypothetical protein